jgi:predicted short-subunit dehydrogenase-like oxidoreductase (DUF2520 family)
MDVSIVGAGRVGTAVAVLLQRAGHRIAAVAGREATAGRAAAYLSGVPVLPAEEAAAQGELVLIGVPDDEIERAAGRIAGAIRPDAWVAHLSGARGLDALGPARTTRVVAIHPLMTVPDVESAIERIPGATTAVTAATDEGFALGERVARDIGAAPFRLADERRALYHAAAVFASNYVVASAGVAEELLREAGVPDPGAALLPLARATLDNIARLGPGDALTGPAVRGDAGTVARNLQALRTYAPHAVPAYVELCRLALDLGARAGRLAPEAKARVEEELARWT